MLEIERKYLLSTFFVTRLNQAPIPVDAMRRDRIRQGYFSSSPWEVRVGLKINLDTNLHTGAVTMKHGVGLVREEIILPMNSAEAKLVLDGLPQTIEKIRYHIDRWEIDVYLGRHKGLVIAEIELENAEEVVPIPEIIKTYLIAEVTGVTKFKNSSLALSNEDIWSTYAI